MARPLGSLNKKTSQTMQTFGELCTKYNISPMELLFQAAAGKIRGIKGRQPLEIRLTAAKELLPYGYAKLSSIKHEVVADKDLRIQWQDDLFLENPTDQELLAIEIDSL